jgi:hypothetical protein
VADRRTPTLIAGILPVLLLAACNGDSAPDATATEVGEVLPGTISDDMLPLDTVTSQPPLMAPEPAPGASRASGTDAADAEADDPAEEDSAAAPAAADDDAAGDAAAD